MDSPSSPKPVNPNLKFGNTKNFPKDNTFWEIVSFVKTLGILIGAALIFRASVVEAFKIPSESMVPTLQPGDHILVSKVSYGIHAPFIKESLYDYSSPKRGDIVVFTRPNEPFTSEDESDINIIKRVIGLPGDTVEVRGTKVFINNQLYPETYARWVLNGIFEGNFGPAKIPENHVLLLGDNRDRSKDSRFWNNPFLDMKRIKGRALMVYWSWHSLSRIGNVIR